MLLTELNTSRKIKPFSAQDRGLILELSVDIATDSKHLFPANWRQQRTDPYLPDESCIVSKFRVNSLLENFTHLPQSLRNSGLNNSTRSSSATLRHRLMAFEKPL